MKFSHSKLTTLLACPMSYYLGYEMGMYKKDIKPALQIGSAVHWGIEHTTEDLTEYFNENGSFQQKGCYSYEQMLAESMVHGYMKHHDEIFDKLLIDIENPGEKLQLLDETHELYLNADLPSGHQFVGIVDLLLLTNKGFIIIDYKTSSKEPDWDAYLDQLYRYIFEVQKTFPEMPVYKIGIINIKKTMIRKKKNENDSDFQRRMRFEYELNDEHLVEYHEFLPSTLDPKGLTDYINNLDKMCVAAASIVQNRLFYINYGNARNSYGRSDWFDVFYRTPNAELLYGISDRIYNRSTKVFEDHRDCVPIDMLVIDEANNEKKKVMNKYNMFKNEYLLNIVEAAQQGYDLDVDEFADMVRQNFIIDETLLSAYVQTYKAELEDINKQGG